MPAAKTKVILFGLGPIGSAIARVLAERPAYEFVGAVDLDPAKVGHDVAAVIGLSAPTGVRVSDKPRKVLAQRADVVMHATGSYLDQVLPQLQMIVRAQHNVISTCEELAQPWAQHPRLANALDRLAKKHGVTVLGTGINPGFAMDILPLALTGSCQQVTSVRVRRVVDASRRRMQLQKKIGTGLTAAAFAEMAARREIRHVGLTESAALLARGLGWQLDQIEEDIAPALATTRVVTDHFTIEPGFVTGVKQNARGWKDGAAVITLELEMRVDAGGSFDEVWIEGKPSLHSVVKGIHGDISTAAVAANVVRRVVDAPPGLVTMVDLPLVSAR